MAIGGLQYVLDSGNHEDWFASSSIWIITYLTIVSLLGFILYHSQTNKNSVFDLQIFKDRNFAVASVLLCFFGLGLYGMMVIQPIMMEGLFNYPVLTAGFMMAPRGISGMVSMIFVGKLITRVDPRWLIVFGILICIYGVSLGTHYSINYIDPFWLVWPMILQGFGLGMIFVPLSTLAYSTLPHHLRTDAAGIFSLLRTLGGSLGISVIITIFTRHTQVFWNEMNGFLNPFNPALYDYLRPLHASPTQPLGAIILNQMLLQQAQMLSFINTSSIILWCFVCMIPLVFLFKKINKTKKFQQESVE